MNIIDQTRGGVGSLLLLGLGNPTENFFGKLSTLENIVPGEEGKKSSDQKKSYNRKLRVTKNLNSDNYRKRRNSNI